jgi:hypothetical protein
MARPTKNLEDMQFDGWDQLDPHLINIRVSRCGNVKNILTGNVLKPYKMRKGHLQVSISNHGVVRKYLVHRIIAKSFILNPDNKDCVNHIDGNPCNNRVENLEWCTDRENKDHARKMGLFQSSTGRYNAVFNEDQILAIHSLKWSHTKIAKHYNVSQSVITRIKNLNTYSNFAVIYDK